jgi:hypothetical protein
MDAMKSQHASNKAWMTENPKATIGLVVVLPIFVILFIIFLALWLNSRESLTDYSKANNWLHASGFAGGARNRFMGSQLSDNVSSTVQHTPIGDPGTFTRHHYDGVSEHMHGLGYDQQSRNDYSQAGPVLKSHRNYGAHAYPDQTTVVNHLNEDHLAQMVQQGL